MEYLANQFKHIKTNSSFIMKKHLSFCLAAFMIFSAALSSCGKDENKSPSEPVASKRYQTVPYTGTRALNTDASGKLIYHGYDDDRNYYVFLLGHVNLVPIAYRQAVYYNGTTPITIGYSKTNATEQSISSAFETAAGYSTNRTLGFSTSISSSIGFKTGIVNGELSVNVGSSLSQETGTSRSTTTTEQTMTSTMEEVTDYIEVTVGNNNEPAGQYRYALMGTTDVYYVLITDRNHTSVDEQYFSLCTRSGTYAWAIDYEPEIGGEFGKTGSGELLTVPDFALADLPEPTERVDKGYIPPPSPVEMPVATPSSSTLNGQTSVTLSTATSGATIYYTMTSNGTEPLDPTKGSTLYNPAIPIVLAQNATTTMYRIKARAYHADLPDSPIMEKTYTMNAAALVTSYTKTLPSTTNQGYHIENIDAKFDIDRLRSAGYTYFSIDFNCTASNTKSFSILAVYVCKGHVSESAVESATKFLYVNEMMIGSGPHSYSSGRIVFADFDNNMTLYLLHVYCNISSPKFTIQAKK